MSLAHGWERVGIENSDRVIAVSKGMREDVLEHFDVEPDKVCRDNIMGIDLGKYRRTDDASALSQYGIEKPYVLFVGRISRQKGIMHLLDALRQSGRA